MTIRNVKVEVQGSKTFVGLNMNAEVKFIPNKKGLKSIDISDVERDEFKVGEDGYWSCPMHLFVDAFGVHNTDSLAYVKDNLLQVDVSTKVDNAPYGVHMEEALNSTMKNLRQAQCCGELESVLQTIEKENQLGSLSIDGGDDGDSLFVEVRRTEGVPAVLDIGNDSSVDLELHFKFCPFCGAKQC